MSKATSIAELPPVERRTVVVNVYTDLLATRAVLSALDLSDSRVTLVNCDPSPASRAHFAALAQERPIDLVEMPLLMHGHVLDRVFDESADGAVLLLDSDAELRTAGHADRLFEQVQHPRCFGAGHTWGPFIIDEEWQAPPAAQILYAERPWVPCVAFDVQQVRLARQAGVSFLASWTPNELRALPRLSNFLAARWGPPWAVPSDRFARLPAVLRHHARRFPLDALRPLRQPVAGQRPHLVVRDTAGEVYDHLRHERGLVFAGTPVDLMAGEVHHYLGATRHVLHGSHALDTDPSDVADEVVRRLSTRYGYRWAGPVNR